MTTLIGLLVVTLVTLSKKEKEEKIETRSKNKQKDVIKRRRKKSKNVWKKKKPTTRTRPHSFKIQGGCLSMTHKHTQFRLQILPKPSANLFERLSQLASKINQTIASILRTVVCASKTANDHAPAT